MIFVSYLLFLSQTFATDVSSTRPLTFSTWILPSCSVSYMNILMCHACAITRSYRHQNVDVMFYSCLFVNCNSDSSFHSGFCIIFCSPQKYGEGISQLWQKLNLHCTIFWSHYFGLFGVSMTYAIYLIAAYVEKVQPESVSKNWDRPNSFLDIDTHHSCFFRYFLIHKYFVIDGKIRL